MPSSASPFQPSLDDLMVPRLLAVEEVGEGRLVPIQVSWDNSCFGALPLPAPSIPTPRLHGHKVFKSPRMSSGEQPAPPGPSEWPGWHWGRWRGAFPSVGFWARAQGRAMGRRSIPGPTGAHLPLLKLLEPQSRLITTVGLRAWSRWDFPCPALGVTFPGRVLLQPSHLSGQVT